MSPFNALEFRTDLAALEKKLRDILRAREEVEKRQWLRKREWETTLEKRQQEQAAVRAEALKRLEARAAREAAAAEERFLRRNAGIDGGYLRALAQAKDRLQQEVDSLKRDQRAGKDAKLRELRERRGIRHKELSRMDGRVGALRGAADGLMERIVNFASVHRVGLRDIARDAGDRPGDSLEAVAETVAAELRACGERLDALGRETWFRVIRFVPLPMVIIPYKRRAHRQVNEIHRRAGRVLALLDGEGARVQDRHKEGKDRYTEEEINIIAGCEETIDREEWEKREALKIRLDRLKTRYAALKKRTVRRRDAETAAARDLAEAERVRIESGEGNVPGDPADRALTGDYEAEIAALSRRWGDILEDFRRKAAGALQTNRSRHPAWNDPSWRNPDLAGKYPNEVYIGDVAVDWVDSGLRAPAGGTFASLDEPRILAPLALAFPAQGSLFIGADSGRSGKALELLFHATLRILTAFPPAKVQYVLIDPVGLGQNFSALMHLNDHDEAVVGGRIWTEPTGIERKLSEVTEHIEKVIQKYLRNRYASIDEYNREVGEMAEPYRFLVIADFPSGFSELALTRLASIITSGVRCGVYTLIYHDRRQKLPEAIDMARLRRNGPVITSDDRGLAVEEDGVRRGSFACGEPPAPAMVSSLLHAIGRKCLEARRVEVSFDVAAPKEGEVWSASAESGVRVPLGRAGADRLQYLDLGRGTAQHALIAGKTGSGKSTLFHVMITNLALWFSPREVEFYLVDFKKGVEFKTFAAHRLPQARVVAIESDREFGLSVLQRLDRELAGRAALFRKAGVQDFAGYRKSEGAEHLPRTVLFIDEFQEFFTDEDAVAQEAALLLDRIVRQGRAFGIHVILGSQTLGGSYTLAKTTLGQMAVRIALQCSESDSYLILSDDNAAARLLSRPGEAIYNDMSGMVEGNNPFQVVWLPDAVEEGHLRRIRQRADREGWTPREPMVVFEGNVFADMRNNAELKGLLAGKGVPKPDPAVRAWVGESNAIKGHTEVRFPRQGGANLLVVGHQREAALAVVTAAAVGIAAGRAPEEVRFVLLDGSDPVPEPGRRLADLAGLLPHPVRVVEYRDVPAVMEELDAEVKARLERGTAGPLVILIVHGLQRFRPLRQGDDFEFSAEDKSSPDRCFANILREGPALGVHTAVWCDSLVNLNRTLSRKTLREFSRRILFQMSAADSAELMDAPDAGALGLYKALLYVEEDGLAEKFRPYALPEDPAWEDFRKAFRARFPSRAG